MLQFQRRSAGKASERPGAWSQERRLEFIEFRLLWEGRLNRGELVDYFGISIPQASLDLARYLQLAPGNLHYDRSDKVYKVGNRFKPVLTRADSQTFLSQLVSLGAGKLHSPHSFIGWRPPCDIVKHPARAIRPEVLMRVIWAVRDHEDLQITYQSMRSPTPMRRWISPHAIAFDGFRWHARAFCHETQDFKDFVFARIQQVHESRAGTADARNDRRWSSFVTVILRPRHDLTPGQRLAVESEFGMREGVLEIRMREALVHYFLRQMQLEQEIGGRDSGQFVELANAEVLVPFLAETLRH
jgi:WYL domain